MGTRSTFLGPPDVTAAKSRPPLSDWGGGWSGPGNSPGAWTVPETDTGGLDEHSEAFGRTMLKELGKLLA
jgi:hypothetical protein